MHPVKCELIKGTGAFASSDSKDQKTFRQEYVLPYSLILFYGIVNDRAAKDAKLSEDEIRLLLDAIWDGTKNLISRTKAGQTPRLLMRVKYSDDHYIGELDKFIKFAYEGEGESIRDISDGKLDFESLANILMTNKKHIDSIELRLNKRMNTDIELAKVIENLGIRLINL